MGRWNMARNNRFTKFVSTIFAVTVGAALVAASVPVVQAAADYIVEDKVTIRR